MTLSANWLFLADTVHPLIAEIAVLRSRGLARSRISRLEALHARTLMETIDLAERLQEAADAHLARAYLETYYGNLHDFHKTVGLSTPPNAVDAKRVESVLQTAWVGKNYSARIWANQAKLADELEATMLQAIHRGSSIQQLSKALSRRMDVAYSNAERLIRTELNAVENRASAAAMKAAEFTHYQFMATLDRRTCSRCGERDGEVYKLSEMNQGENAPPMHARCRCTIVAYLDGVGKGERVAGRQRLPEGVTYKQWRARYVDGLPTAASNAKVGLSAGDKASALGASGISPYYIGFIDFKDAAQIKRVLDYYEPLIVKELVENAIIITRSGDIYHCTGTLNDLDTIVELGDKLRGAIVTHNHPIGSDNDYSFSLKDRYLFENYKLARLRGIDEKFIYELNRNSAFLDSEDDVVAGDEETFTNSHLRNIQLARFLGFGYRRWRHE